MATTQVGTIHVDREACCGNGMCVALAPEWFDLDENGVVVLLAPNVTAEQVDTIDRAAANCPTAAITLGRSNA
jgi:ferredoxin